ncbi:hypothetical protein D5018_07575 [Parashewanella curva]|uniref:Uncharacterized protein n=1 Tax=Parashewanella curva TaxID=2338552 RepID=A0A3L8PYR6_9GAMM|nr:hypothetical protein [Parashewanella curva]RLV60370.1 hypothetical protein D5018_07575 [Parashewanella curva]
MIKEASSTSVAQNNFLSTTSAPLSPKKGSTPDWQIQSRLNDLFVAPKALQQDERYITAVQNLERWFDDIVIAQACDYESEFQQCITSCNVKNDVFNTSSSTLNRLLAFEVKSQNAKVVSEIFVQYYSNSQTEGHWSKSWTTYNDPEIAIIIAFDIILLLAIYKPATVYSKLMSAKHAYSSVVVNREKLLDSNEHVIKLNKATIVPYCVLFWLHQVPTKPSSHKFTDLTPDGKAFINTYVIKRCLLTSDKPIHGCQPIDTKLIRNGEEFEYYPPNRQSKRMMDFQKLMLLNQWRDTIKSKLLSLNIPLTHCTFDLDEKSQTLNYQIGSWHAKLFFDGWLNYTLPEVNVSPYRIGETVKIGDIEMSMSAMLSTFITDLARQFGLRASSGHKHIDLSQAAGYNPEFLFRLLVDVENNAWLTQCFDTAEYTHKTKKYLIQEPDSNIAEFQGLLTVFNELLKAGYRRKSKGDFADNAIVLQLLDLAWGVAPNDDKYRPLKIPVNLGQKYKQQIAAAEQGLVVSHPNSTIEFRIFNCARNGQEAIKISKLISAWISKIAQEQKQTTPIHYRPINPKVPIEQAKLKLMFDDFIKSLGLEPEEYRELLWI